jgi:DNA-binding beta-propeller fold protein YncE
MSRPVRAGALAALLASVALPASAQVFNRVAAFAAPLNLPEGTDPATETSAEIIAASPDGMTLVYTDSPLGAVGIIDIADPAAPKPGGSVAVGGEPTSVVVVGGRAIAGVNTSESFTAPTGHLAVIDLATRRVEKSCDLGGQPDSVALAPDGSFLAVAVENERDEDVNDGAIPQAPGGHVEIIPLRDGLPDCAAAIRASVTGLAAVAPEDPEPEFVAISETGEIAVTLQENNHVVVLARDGSVVSHFSAGAADLEGIDTARDGRLTFDTAKAGVLREPDSVKWLPGGRLVTANEGDWEGGSRGFTIFSKTGEVLWESGASMERAIARIGHYPEHRSRSKGVEPEGLEVAAFGDTTYIFVLNERASIAAVYRDTGAAPELVQLLPSGVSPEGAVAIPARGLFVTANEVDLGEDGLARAHVMIYALGDGPAAYPTLVSGDDAAGNPIGWGALSGLAADPATPGLLYAVSDSVYGMQPTIFTIDAAQTPARITAATRVTRFGQPAQKLDVEGIVPDGEGGFWLASEGRSDRLIPHALYRVDAKGEIKAEVPFPAAALAHETRFGAEGIAKVGDVLWVAIQREWADDPAGQVKLLAYDTAAEEWLGAVRYPLEPKGEGWIGLSEIAVHGDHAYVVERDNLVGGAAVVKRLYRVPLAALTPAPLGGELPVVPKEPVRDFIPDLKTWGGYVVDKVEGFVVDAAGTGWAVTDNDGVDDSSGETFLWSVGKL